jgi:hypothetical protein
VLWGVVWILLFAVLLKQDPPSRFISIILICSGASVGFWLLLNYVDLSLGVDFPIIYSIAQYSLGILMGISLIFNIINQFMKNTEHSKEEAK